LAEAIEHLAAKHLVHRDIKPDNIMFRGKSWSPVLVDFGVVRDLTKSSVTQSFALMGPGTPYFAAPEQLVNDKHLIDWRTDQFSLGVTLVVAMRGQHPFHHAGDTELETIERVAARGALSDEFVAWTEASAFAMLRPMLGGWPVERISTPALLIKAFA
jgi:serine/threonine protein kinase